MENGKFVEFKNLSKSYKGFQALKNISFTIRKGEVLGYVGPNGAGKTTTIKSMVGLISDFDGGLSIGGLDLPRDRHKVHKIIGYLPQSVAFQEWRTVEHALETFGSLSGLGPEELETRITETLELVGITEYRHKKITELSGGNMQKVGLAQALLHEPQLLILDEPLAGLDPASRYNVKQIIKRLSEKGITVFFSSHILSDVQDVATRIAIVSYGELLKCGTLDELKAEFAAPNVLEIDSYSPIGNLLPYRQLQGVKDINFLENGKISVHMEPGADQAETSNMLLGQMMSAGHRIKSFGPVNLNLDELYNRYVARGVVQ